MKYNKGFSSIVLLIVILLVLSVGGVAYFTSKSSTPKNEVIDNSKYLENVDENKMVDIAPKEEMQSNVPDQNAYLIKAYEENGKNYIDVDFVNTLYGQESLQAQVEDGMCPNIDECYDFPNGYKRNQNPLVRTFEVNANAPITIGGLLFSKKFDIAFTSDNDGSSYYTSGDYYNDYVANQNNRNSDFTEFKKLISLTTSYLPYNPPYKKPITYIKINIQNNLVTSIVEPYQE